MRGLNLGLYREVYSLEFRRLMTYRSEFWFRFVGTLLATLAMAYFLWSAVYEARGATEIEGYSLKGMVLYYLLLPLVTGISRGQEAVTVSWEIYDGSLTRFLVYPVSYFPYQYVVALAGKTLAALQLVIVVTLFTWISDFPPEMAVTPASVALGILTALVASLLSFAMVSVVEMTAFWADNVWSLNVMLMFSVNLLGGGMLPLALFPETLQQILALTPFPYVVSFPLLTLTGGLDAGQWARGMLAMTAWLGVILGLGALVWRRGMLRYTGVGI